jgi:hypothetical protein
MRPVGQLEMFDIAQNYMGAPTNRAYSASAAP